MLSIVLASSCQKADEPQLWRVLTMEYVKQDAALVQNEADKRNTALQDFAARSRAEKNLLAVAGPPNNVLENLLRSKEAEDRKLALVNVMLRKINQKDLLKTILETYRRNDDMFTKFYSIQCFKNLSQSELKIFENNFVGILRSETNEIAIVAAIPMLAKMDQSKVRPLFAEYVKTGSQGLRDVVRIYVNE
jgi:hypothetical protein